MYPRAIAIMTVWTLVLVCSFFESIRNWFLTDWGWIPSIVATCGPLKPNMVSVSMRFSDAVRMGRVMLVALVLYRLVDDGVGCIQNCDGVRHPQVQGWSCDFAGSVLKVCDGEQGCDFLLCHLIVLLSSFS